MIKNKIKIYNYLKREISTNVKLAFMLLILATFLLVFDLIFAILCEGEAPLFVGAFGLTSLVLLFSALYLNVKECLEVKKVYSESFFCFVLIFFNIVMWLFCIIL